VGMGDSVSGWYLEVYTHIYLGLGVATLALVFLRLQVGPAHRRPDRLEFRRGRRGLVVHQVVDHLQIGLGLDSGLRPERQPVLMYVANGDRQLLAKYSRSTKDDVVVVGEAIALEDLAGVFYTQGEVEDEAGVPLVGGGERLRVTENVSEVGKDWVGWVEGVVDGLLSPRAAGAAFGGEIIMKLHDGGLVELHAEEVGKIIF